MIYTVYSPINGAITGTLVVDNVADIGSGINYIQGQYNANDYYIKNETAVKYPARPSNNSWVSYLWDSQTETWTINETKTSANAKEIRNVKFIAVDRINPIWWSQISDNQRAEATAYRQALLDIPQQAGYPVNINWPSKPDWL